MKNSNDTNCNRTSDLPICNAGCNEGCKYLLVRIELLQRRTQWGQSETEMIYFLDVLNKWEIENYKKTATILILFSYKT